VQDNYFKRLFFSTVTSFAVLVIVSVASAKGGSVPPWLAVLLSMGPLFHYHYYLWRKADKGLSSSAIDSVYYFGFLITVAALGISAVSIAVRGAVDSLSTVVYQFGTGLFATGYAVIARMHLTSASTRVDDASPEAIADRYVKKSLEMVDNVEMASVRLADFSQTMMLKTSEISETARSAAEKAMLEVARAFQEEMKSTLSIAREGISEIRGMVADTSFTAEREQLAKSMKATIEAVTGLNLALLEMASRAREGAQVTQQSALNATRLEQALLQMSARIDELSDPDAGLAKAAKQLVEVSDSMSEAASATGYAVQAMTEIGKDVQATGPAFKSMTKASKKVHDQLDTLGGVAGRMSDALASLEGTATITEKLATELQHVATAMPAVGESAEALQHKFAKACVAAETLEARLTSLPQNAAPVRDLADTVAQSLKLVAEQVAVTAQHAKSIGQGTGDSEKAAQAANRFAEAIERLRITTQSLELQLKNFSDSAINTQRLLNETTTEVKATLKHSAEAIEADARRSSLASTMLTESLVGVAKTIVEQTRTRQGAAA
jgi:hypothetical protein